MNKSDNLDALTQTFSKDKEFFEALTASPSFDELCKMLVYAKWWRRSHVAMLEGLSNAVSSRFPAKLRDDAFFWTAALAIQICKDIGFVTYLSCRGLTLEAGGPIRRMLENIGVLSHVWETPDKASSLRDAGSAMFRDAFLHEKDQKVREVLRKQGIAKRFAALPTPSGLILTRLYKLASNRFIHGGTPNHSVGIHVEQNPFWCFLYPRPLPTDRTFIVEVDICTKGVEIVTVEYSVLVGKFSVRSPEILEAGRYMTELLRDKCRLSDEIQSIKSDLLSGVC